jgi:hypothetical protein
VTLAVRPDITGSLLDIISIFPPSWEAVMLTFTTDEAMVMVKRVWLSQGYIRCRAPFISKIRNSYASVSSGFYYLLYFFALFLAALLKKSATKKFSHSRIDPNDLFFRRDHPHPHTTLHVVDAASRRPPLDHRQRTRPRAHRQHQCKSTCRGGMIHGADMDPRRWVGRDFGGRRLDTKSYEFLRVLFWRDKSYHVCGDAFSLVGEG